MMAFGNGGNELINDLFFRETTADNKTTDPRKVSIKRMQAWKNFMLLIDFVHLNSTGTRLLMLMLVIINLYQKVEIICMYVLGIWAVLPQQVTQLTIQELKNWKMKYKIVAFSWNFFCVAQVFIFYFVEELGLKWMPVPMVINIWIVAIWGPYMLGCTGDHRNTIACRIIFNFFAVLVYLVPNDILATFALAFVVAVNMGFDFITYVMMGKMNMPTEPFFQPGFENVTDMKDVDCLLGANCFDSKKLQLILSDKGDMRPHWWNNDLDQFNVFMIDCDLNPKSVEEVKFLNWKGDITRNSHRNENIENTKSIELFCPKFTDLGNKYLIANHSIKDNDNRRMFDEFPNDKRKASIVYKFHNRKTRIISKLEGSLFPFRSMPGSNAELCLNKFFRRTEIRRNNQQQQNPEHHEPIQINLDLVDGEANEQQHFIGEVQPQADNIEPNYNNIDFENNEEHPDDFRYKIEPRLFSLSTRKKLLNVRIKKIFDIGCKSLLPNLETFTQDITYPIENSHFFAISLKKIDRDDQGPNSIDIVIYDSIKRKAQVLIKSIQKQYVGFCYNKEKKFLTLIFYQDSLNDRNGKIDTFTGLTKMTIIQKQFYYSQTNGVFVEIPTKEVRFCVCANNFRLFYNEHCWINEYYNGYILKGGNEYLMFIKSMSEYALLCVRFDEVMNFEGVEYVDRVYFDSYWSRSDASNGHMQIRYSNKMDWLHVYSDYMSYTKISVVENKDR